MNFTYFEKALTLNSFDVSIVIMTLFLIVLVTIEPHRSLLTVRYHGLFKKKRIFHIFVLMNLIPLLYGSLVH